MRRGSPPQVRGKRGRASAQRRRKRITPAGAGKTTFMVVGTAGEEDHPRRCGENRAFFRSHRTASGSPPQVRGKPFRFLLRLHKLRITPAGAGKTPRTAQHRASSQDHPRRCGENKFTTAASFAALGSPPQVRGKHYAELEKLCSDGITPAGAGKT